MPAGIELTGVLGDVVFLAIVVSFFALCAAFVKACDVIAGPDPAGTRDGGALDEPAAAGAAAEITDVTA